MRRVDSSKRLCLNPKCLNVINKRDVPARIVYCTPCQIQLQEYRKAFPQAQKKDLIDLLCMGKVRLYQAARMLGINRGTFFEYCAKGTIKFYLENRSRFIDENTLMVVYSKIVRIVKLSYAAQIIHIKADRLRYLIAKGYIPYTRDFIGQVGLRRFDLRRIRAIDENVRRTEGQRRAKTKTAKPSNEDFSVSQAAAILDIEPEGIRWYIRQKKLKAQKKGLHWFIAKEDFSNFCHACIDRKIISHHKTVIGAQKYLDSLTASNIS